MQTRRIRTALSAIILAAFATGLYFYPRMPEMMASHWNAAGEVDGYMSKFWGLFLIPAILAALIFLLLIFPKIDPFEKNFRKFRKYYDGFMVAFSIFMLFIYLHSILWNIGIRLPTNLIIPASSGILFFYLGHIMKHLKRNWFIGIRTPWTLSSDKVWGKTHEVGGKLFKVAGFIAVAGVFSGNYAVYLIIFPVLAIIAFSFVYSYLQYKK